MLPPIDWLELSRVINLLRMDPEVYHMYYDDPPWQRKARSSHTPRFAPRNNLRRMSNIKWLLKEVCVFAKKLTLKRAKNYARTV